MTGGSSTDKLPAVQALYDDAPCGLLVTAADGAILRVNRTFCAWVGYDAAELVGRRKLQDLLTVGGRIFHQTHWAPLMRIQGSVSELKLELLAKNGGRLPTVWNAVRRVADGDAAVHEVAVFVAEDRHKYEQELLLARRRAEDLLAKEQDMQLTLHAAQVERDRLRALAEDRALFAEQMMAIVSHDLRNPLAIIRLSSQVVALDALSARQKGALERLARATLSASRLIADLLDFSRGRIGTGLQVEVQAIDLHHVVAEALDDLRAAHPGRSIEHRRVAAGACVGSRDRLVQLLGNLVVNAITYGAPDSPVVVTTAIDPQAFSIVVHNRGEVIPASLLPKLFEPMTRGSATAGSTTSVGLGLFIVREIARAHGGGVEAVSNDVDGTTFTATFPRRGVGTSPAAQPSDAAAGGAAPDPAD